MERQKELQMLSDYYKNNHEDFKAVVMKKLPSDNNYFQHHAREIIEQGFANENFVYLVEFMQEVAKISQSMLGQTTSSEEINKSMQIALSPHLFEFSNIVLETISKIENFVPAVPAHDNQSNPCHSPNSHKNEIE